MKTIYLLGIVGQEITADLLQSEMPKNSKERLRLILDTNGGSVSEGIRLYNVIRSYPGEVEIILGSMVASIGSYIAMSVPRENRKSFKNSSMMMHEAQGALQGRARDFSIFHSRLVGVNNIIAEAYAENMEKSKDEILALMSEDYYITGWEQLVNHNLISDIVDPKDITFPEPTQNKSLFDLLFAQLEKQQDENTARESMYNAEEWALKKWKNEILQLDKIAAFLPLDDTGKSNISTGTQPANKPDNNNQEVSDMTLKELLDKHPEAKAEYENNLHAAEAKGAELVKNDRQRIARILNNAGITLTNDAVQAIEGDVEPGQFAEQELARQRGLRNEQSTSPFTSLVANKQIPGDQDPGGKKDAQNSADADAEFDKKVEESAKKFAKAGRF